MNNSSIEKEVEEKIADETHPPTVDAGATADVNQLDNAEQNKASDVPEEANASQHMDPLKIAMSVLLILNQFTVQEQEEIDTITLWILFSWLHYQATVSPILNISSPEKRCGKSTTLNVLSKLCCNALLASNISSAALHRIIGEESPTLLVDEIDTLLHSNKELLNILNASHYKDSASVIRCSGKSHAPVQIPTWCPKVTAGIGFLPETLADRSITIPMVRKLVSQEIKIIRHANDNEFKALRIQLALFSERYADEFKKHTSERLLGLNDRANDNWEPLFSIAEILGGDWPERAKRAALKLSSVQEEKASDGELLLGDISLVLDNTDDQNISTNKLISLLCEDDEMPWKTLNRGKNITPNDLSMMLKPFNIKPKTVRLINSSPKKGYQKAVFSDAFNRYVGQPSEIQEGTTD